jgi:hypothetical protein
MRLTSNRASLSRTATCCPIHAPSAVRRAHSDRSTSLAPSHGAVPCGDPASACATVPSQPCATHASSVQPVSAPAPPPFVVRCCGRRASGTARLAWLVAGRSRRSVSSPRIGPLSAPAAASRANLAGGTRGSWGLSSSFPTPARPVVLRAGPTLPTIAWPPSWTTTRSTRPRLAGRGSPRGGSNPSTLGAL